LLLRVVQKVRFGVAGLAANSGEADHAGGAAAT